MADGKKLEEAMDFIDRMTAPDKMSKAEAKDFQEMLIDRLRSNVEALDEEMKNEEED